MTLRIDLGTALLLAFVSPVLEGNQTDEVLDKFQSSDRVAVDADECARLVDGRGEGAATVAYFHHISYKLDACPTTEVKMRFDQPEDSDAFFGFIRENFVRGEVLRFRIHFKTKGISDKGLLITDITAMPAKPD